MEATLDTAELDSETEADVAAAEEEEDDEDVELVAPLEDVPVQLDSSGTATALATPAPITRNIARRFMPVLRSSASKSEPVTFDLRFAVGVHRPPNANRTFHVEMVKSTDSGHGTVTVVIQPTLNSSAACCKAAQSGPVHVREYSSSRHHMGRQSRPQQLTPV